MICPAEFWMLWGIYRPSVLRTYPSWGTRIPGGTGYWGHYIDRGQKIFTSWGPEEHHAYRCHSHGGWPVVHSCGDCEIDMPMGSRSIVHRFYVMHTEASDFVLGTDFSPSTPRFYPSCYNLPMFFMWTMMTESVPLEQSEHTSSYLIVCKKERSAMMVASKTESYQLLGGVLDQGLKELGYSREDLNVELFASDKQHVLDIYGSKGQNCCYKYYWPFFGMAYGNLRFSELGKVLTKVALERSRMVLCSPNGRARGGNEY